MTYYLAYYYPAVSCPDTLYRLVELKAADHASALIECKSHDLHGAVLLRLVGKAAAPEIEVIG